MKKLIAVAVLLTGSAFLSLLSWAEEADKPKLQQRYGLWYEVGKSEPFTGKDVIYYPNGQKFIESNYKNGRPDGLRVEYYENGQKKEEGNIIDGKMEGLWVEWYRNGQKKSECHWKDGKKDGLSVWWYENGKKKFKGNFKEGRQIN